MDQKNYHTEIDVACDRESSVAGIHNIRAWWAQDVEGNADKVGDRFTVRFGNTWAIFEIVVMVKDEIIWSVVDSYLDLLDDKKEWNDTKLICQITTVDQKTRIDLTHQGLTPEKQCFEDCTKGWNFYINNSLSGFLDRNEGLPGEGIHAWLSIDGAVYEGKLYTKDQTARELTGDLIILDVKQVRGEAVQSNYSVKKFDGNTGNLRGSYYMLIKYQSNLLGKLESFTVKSPIK
jgi:hypothetical protein